jgi:hypothetical protein
MHDLRRALTAVIDQHRGPHVARRILGPALDLAAALAVAQGQASRAVTLLHAADSVLTLSGAVPNRPQARWSNELRAKLEADLDAAAYAEAATRGSAMSAIEALRWAGLRLPPAAPNRVESPANG